VVENVSSDFDSVVIQMGEGKPRFMAAAQDNCLCQHHLPKTEDAHSSVYEDISLAFAHAIHNLTALYKHPLAPSTPSMPSYLKTSCQTKVQE
jgi:hypothetical protein